jgi:DNA-binding winged helix-turn-helix (wHTH) protein
MWSLVEAATGNVIVELVESQAVTLGRDSACGVVISSHLISRQHARVGWADGVPVVQDLGSRNGTSLNNAPLEPNQTQALQHGDVIGIGPWLARVVAHEATLTAMNVPITNLQSLISHLQIDEAKRDVWVRGTLLHPPLSEPQFVLLRTLAQANGGWVSRAACAQDIWPEAKGGDLNEALDGVIKRLRARLREASDEQLIEMRRGLGLRII